MIYNYYFAIFILALIFFFISNKNVSILISIIIIILIGYYFFSKIDKYNQNLQTNFNNKVKKINEDIKIKSRYLEKDRYLIDLVLNIRFIKLFDEDKYSKLLLHMEEFMKIYIFILADRYDIKDYFSTFINLRTTIIKELYGIYIILPMKLKYVFNINTFETIQETIHKFMKYSRRMIITLENYGFKGKGLYYLQDTKYKPYEKNNMEVF